MKNNKFPNEINENIIRQIDDFDSFFNIRLCCKSFYNNVEMHKISRLFKTIRKLKNLEKWEIFRSSHEMYLSRFLSNFDQKIESETWNSIEMYTERNTSTLLLIEGHLETSSNGKISIIYELPTQYVIIENLSLDNIIPDVSYIKLCTNVRHYEQKDYLSANNRSIFKGLMPIVPNGFRKKVEIFLNRSLTDTTVKTIPKMVVKCSNFKEIKSQTFIENLIVEQQSDEKFIVPCRNGIVASHSLSLSVVAVCLKGDKNILLSIKNFKLKFQDRDIIDINDPYILLDKNLGNFLHKDRIFENKITNVIKDINTDKTLVIPVLNYVFPYLPSATRSENITTVIEFYDSSPKEKNCIQTIFLTLNSMRTQVYWNYHKNNVIFCAEGLAFDL